MQTQLSAPRQADPSEAYRKMDPEMAFGRRLVETEGSLTYLPIPCLAPRLPLIYLVLH